MEDLDLVGVYTVRNATTAEIIKNALEVEGIACTLEGENQAGLAGIFDIEVMVRGVDAERAREIIKAHIEDNDEAMEGLDVGEPEA